MNEWRECRLGELAGVLRRGTAPAYVEASAVRAIGQRCVRNDGFEAAASRPHDSRVGAAVRPETGDVLINSTGTGTIGRSCVFREAQGEFMVDGHVTLVRPADSVADGRFLNELVRSPDGQRFLESHCFTGSTNQIELSRTQLSEMRVVAPPLGEQRRIAEILDTIDETIQATERVIAKLEVCRAGLVQELVSTSSGWPQRPILDLLRQVVDNRGRTPPYTKSGVPVISAENVGGGVVRSTTKWVTEETYRGWTRGVPTPGDVLVTTEAPVGEVALLPGEKPYLLTRRVVALGPDRSQLAPEYLYWFLRHFKVAGRWEALSHGTTVPRLLKPDLLEIQIGLAPLSHQQLLVGPVAAVAERLVVEKASLRKLRLTRAGLAADLLSGRVRTAAA